MFTRINQNLTELSGSLDVRYNPATDMLQIKINGVWTDYKKAYMQNLTIFADGSFMNNFAFGANTNYSSSYTLDGGLSITGSVIDVSIPTSINHDRGSRITPAIDLSQYHQITMEMVIDGVARTEIHDLTQYTQTAYLAILALRGSSSVRIRYGFVTAASGDFANSSLFEQDIVVSQTAQSISSIVLE